jgi:hypothetical protein
MTPDELRAYLDTNPGDRYADLGDDAKTLLNSLRSGPQGFTDQQRTWLTGFYLVVPSQATLDTITAKLLPTLGLSAQTTLDDELVLSASLLTDCISPTDTWNAIAVDLAALEIRAIAPDRFPVLTVEDL